MCSTCSYVQLVLSDTDEVGCLCIAEQERRLSRRDVMAALLPLAAALVSNVMLCATIDSRLPNIDCVMIVIAM